MSLISVEESLFENAKKTPDKVAVIAGSDRLTYRALARNICAAWQSFKNRKDLQVGESKC